MTYYFTYFYIITLLSIFRSFKRTDFFKKRNAANIMFCSKITNYRGHFLQFHLHEVTNFLEKSTYFDVFTHLFNLLIFHTFVYNF